jgi:hypothetical protein
MRVEAERVLAINPNGAAALGVIGDRRLAPERKTARIGAAEPDGARRTRCRVCLRPTTDRLVVRAAEVIVDAGAEDVVGEMGARHERRIGAGSGEGVGKRTKVHVKVFELYAPAW